MININKKFAEETYCPFSMNNSNENSSMCCVTDSCMAWYSKNDNAGYCQLIHNRNINTKKL